MTLNQILMLHSTKSICKNQNKYKKFWKELIFYFSLIQHGTKPLPSNGRRDTHTDTQTDMKCAVEIGSGAMVCIPDTINISSGIKS
jgi:hypothetical protein